MISNQNNKIWSFYSDAKKLYNNELIIPRFVSIWLSTVCDLGCDYCFFSKYNKSTRQFINTQKLYTFIDELASLGTEAIEFSGGGEPTLHPDCFNIAEYAVKRGLKVGLLTNGAKFDFDKIKYFSYIRIGLDAIDNIGYRKIKKSNKTRFDKTITSIKKLKSYTVSGRPRIGVKFMLTKENCMEIASMIEFALKLGVDYCHFKATHTDSNSIKNLDLINRVENILKYFKAKSPKFVYGSIVREKLKTKCFMSPIHTVITANGDLLVCCYFYNKEHIVGSVFKDSFSKVWFSKKHIELLDSITPKECNKYDCRWIKYNNEMKGIIEKGEHDLSFI